MFRSVLEKPVVRIRLSHSLVEMHRPVREPTDLRMHIQLIHSLCCTTSPREDDKMTEGCHDEQFVGKDITEFCPENQEAFMIVSLSEFDKIVDYNHPFMSAYRT